MRLKLWLGLSPVIIGYGCKYFSPQKHEQYKIQSKNQELSTPARNSTSQLTDYSSVCNADQDLVFANSVTGTGEAASCDGPPPNRYGGAWWLSESNYNSKKAWNTKHCEDAQGAITEIEVTYNPGSQLCEPDPATSGQKSSKSGTLVCCRPKDKNTVPVVDPSKFDDLCSKAFPGASYDGGYGCEVVIGPIESCPMAKYGAASFCQDDFAQFKSLCESKGSDYFAIVGQILNPERCIVPQWSAYYQQNQHCCRKNLLATTTPVPTPTVVSTYSPQPSPTIYPTPTNTPYSTPTNFATPTPTTTGGPSPYPYP
jgi:hypothetical protein